MKGIFQQFAKPEENALGWLAGWLMARKNRDRSERFLQRLAAREGESILEVGFGPGVDLVRVRRAVGPSGRVAGVDASAEMLRQAGSRAVEHRADIRLGSAETLPWEGASFDAVLSINSIAFWPDPQAGVVEIHRVLRPGGRVLVAMQPMWRGATEADSRGWAERLRTMAAAVGFEILEAATSAPLRPTPTAFLTARKSSQLR